MKYIILLIATIGCGSNLQKHRNNLKMDKVKNPDVGGPSSLPKEDERCQLGDGMVTTVEAVVKAIMEKASNSPNWSNLIPSNFDNTRKKELFKLLFSKYGGRLKGKLLSDVIEEDNLELTQLLISIDVSLINAPLGESGDSPIMVAIHSKSNRVLEAFFSNKSTSIKGKESVEAESTGILSRVDLEIVNSEGLTPLILAILENDKYSVKDLVENGADIDNEVMRLSPVGWAAKEKRNEIVKYLLAKEAKYLSQKENFIMDIKNKGIDALISTFDTVIASSSPLNKVASNVESVIKRTKINNLSYQEVMEANAAVRLIKHRELDWILLRNNFNSYGIYYVYRRLSGFKEIDKIKENKKEKNQKVKEALKIARKKMESSNAQEESENSLFQALGKRIRFSAFTKLVRKKDNGLLANKIADQAKEIMDIIDSLESLKKLFSEVDEDSLLGTQVDKTIIHIKSNLCSDEDWSEIKDRYMEEEVTSLAGKFAYGIKDSLSRSSYDKLKDEDIVTNTYISERKLLQNVINCSRINGMYTSLAKSYALGELKNDKTLFVEYENIVKESIMITVQIDEQIKGLKKKANVFRSDLSKKEVAR